MKIVMAVLEPEIGKLHFPKAMEKHFKNSLNKSRTFSSVAKEILARNWAQPVEERWMGWLIAATFLYSRRSKRKMVEIALDVFLPIEKHTNPCLVGTEIPVKIIRAYIRNRPIPKVNSFTPGELGEFFLSMSKYSSLLHRGNSQKTETYIRAQTFALGSLGNLLCAVNKKTRKETAQTVTLSIIDRVYCEATSLSEEHIPMTEIRSVFSPIIDKIQKSI